MSFNEIIGQEIAKALLKKDIQKNRVASSYLFCGKKGVGKKITAQNFAKALNCHGRGEKPCDGCANCNLINSGNFPDLIMVSPNEKGSIKIEIVREIKERLRLRTTGRRVVIVEDADTMTHEAQNAFLKTLEEPPLDTTIILTTSRLHRLFPTIVSRCKIVRFRQLKKEEIVELLKTQGVKKPLFISNLSGGSIERAITFSDLKIRDDAVRFVYLEKKKRLHQFKNFGEVKELIDCLYIIYGDLLSVNFGLPIKNTDLLFPDIGVESTLMGMGVIEKAIVALNQNVAKKHILHYLAYNLPRSNITKNKADI